MADGSHLEKSKIGHISAKVRPIGTKFGLETHIGLPYRTGRQNFELLKIQDGGRRNLEKLKNGHIAATVHAINIKFGTLMHIGPANRYSSQNFQLLKTQTQDGGPPTKSIYWCLSLCKNLVEIGAVVLIC